jgi:hypothetical protein
MTGCTEHRHNQTATWLAVLSFSAVTSLVFVDWLLEDGYTRVGPVRDVMPSLGEKGLDTGDSLFLLWVLAAFALLALLWLRPAPKWRRLAWPQIGLRVLVSVAIVGIVSLWLFFIGLRAGG